MRSAGETSSADCPYTRHQDAGQIRAGEVSALGDGGTRQEAISTDRAVRPAGPYSQGVRWENLIFTASVGTRDPKTGQDAPADDVAAGARNALENVKAIVEAGGGSLETVLKVTLYLRDFANFAAVNEVYKTYFTGPVLPVRSLVVLPGSPSAVSFDAIAYRP